MKNTTNLLILNLAVADLLFILVCVPATASDYILMYWPFGLTWCRTVQYIIYVTAYVSIYTLVLMAADRLVLVKELNLREDFKKNGKENDIVQKGGGVRKISNYECIIKK